MLEDVFNEDILKPKKKKTIKTSTLLLISIIVLVILCLVVVVALMYLRSTILKVTVDGQNASQLKDMVIIEENDKIYFPIRRMAEYLGYNSYNGDYVTRSEDATKCYIENEEELVSFTLNSNVLTKVISGQTQQTRITEAIKEINGELCITSDGSQDAFNLKFNYDKEKNNITIQTLNYLYNVYTTYYQESGFIPIDETFENKTAVLDNMIIVKSENNYYGVISIAKNELILETKYDSIQYVRTNSEFIVGSNNKKGIIKTNKETKVELIYDDIIIIPNKNQFFYLIQKSNLYGILDENGDILLYPEYEQIGIDVTPYRQNGVTVGNILFNQVFPIRRNNKWALYNLEGKPITDFIYDSFGCTSAPSNVTRTYGVLQISNYNLLVVSQNGKYNLITLEGKGLFNALLDSVYITISDGKNIYNITSGNTTKDLISLLEENGFRKVE